MKKSKQKYLKGPRLVKRSQPTLNIELRNPKSVSTSGDVLIRLVQYMLTQLFIHNAAHFGATKTLYHFLAYCTFLLGMGKEVGVVTLLLVACIAG